MRIINVVGYEGLYVVTDDGRIYSSKRGNELKQRLNNGGYYYVSLCKEGKLQAVPVHKAVFYSFNAYSRLTRTDDLVIDHIDGNKTNNSLDNLRKITTRENTSRAKHNIYGKGVHYFKNRNLYGAEITINTIRYHLGTFKTPQEAAEKYQSALNAFEKDGTLPFKRDRSTKYCKTCKQTKPISDFYHIRGHGFQTLCKECQRAYCREYRRKLKALKMA